MGFSENRLTIAGAREKDMVTALSQMGLEAVKISRNNYWYHSPLRIEKTPSFKVSRRLNRWYDYGFDKGGNLVDFAVLLWSCSVSEALQRLTGNFFLQQPILHSSKKAEKPEPKTKVLKAVSLSLKVLLQCAFQRGNNAEIIRHFCCELNYGLNGKKWFCIGFKNDLAGYGISSTFQKLSSSPKTITKIKNGSTSVVVFEGFFEMLCFTKRPTLGCFINSAILMFTFLPFLEPSKIILQSYSYVRLYLDNGDAGRKTKVLAFSWGNQFHDNSILYAGYDYYNEWLVDTINYSKIDFGNFNQNLEKPPNPFNKSEERSYSA